MRSNAESMHSFCAVRKAVQMAEGVGGDTLAAATCRWDEPLAKPWAAAARTPVLIESDAGARELREEEVAGEDEAEAAPEAGAAEVRQTSRVCCVMGGGAMLAKKRTKAGKRRTRAESAMLRESGVAHQAGLLLLLLPLLCAGGCSAAKRGEAAQSTVLAR